MSYAKSYVEKFTKEELEELREHDKNSSWKTNLSKKQIEAIEMSRKERKGKTFSEVIDDYSLDGTMSDEERLAHKAAYFHQYKQKKVEEVAEGCTLIEIDTVIKRIKHKEDRQKDIKNKNKHKLLTDLIQQDRGDYNLLQVAREKRYINIADKKEKEDFHIQ